MKKLQTLIAILLTGVAVAVTYHVFENAVHMSIDFIWHDTFDTDAVRWLVIPVAIVLSLIFFGLQHKLDPRSEKIKGHGPEAAPSPTFANYIKILAIGFLSLVAGATLGPEAVLIPACAVLGSLIGTCITRESEVSAHVYTAAGLMALFTAFFDSFIIGILSLWLVLTRQKTKLTPMLLITAVVASGASKLTLNVIEGEPYVQLPAYGWHLDTRTMLSCIVLAVAGLLAVQLMGWLINMIDKPLEKLRRYSWIVQAILAGGVLAILYILGGPLVEFTGNTSIVPMFEQASELGLYGLAWIIIIKIMAISWSKAIGYRGGMIFPTIFIAAVLVAIVQIYVPEFNYMYGLIAVIIGALIADKRSHVLV